MVHDLQRHYDGYDAKCRKCGASYRAFCCMNVGEMCNECFQRAFAAFTEAMRQKSVEVNYE